MALMHGAPPALKPSHRPSQHSRDEHSLPDLHAAPFGCFPSQIPFKHQFEKQRRSLVQGDPAPRGTSQTPSMHWNEAH